MHSPELARIYNPVLSPSVNGSSYSPEEIFQLYLRNFITVAIGAAGVFFFIRLLMAGLAYINAGGDKEAVQKATASLKNALIGILVVLSLFALTWVVETLFGISIFQMTLPSL
jgi:hypothetical protein